MAYLGINPIEANKLASVLRMAVRAMDASQRLIAEAERTADISAAVTLLLDQIESDYEQTAAALARAVAVVTSFQLQLPNLVSWSAWPTPIRTPTPIASTPTSHPTTAGAEATQWNALPSTAWNDVAQVSSHNSYTVAGGLPALFDLGIRSFELDIHQGPPVSLASSLTFMQRALGIGRDELAHDNDARPAPDWRVYHMTGDAHTEYEYLSDGLAAVAGLDTTDPLTVFIDNKDPFAASHPVEAFDALLDAALGDRLYRPADLLERAPQAGSLAEVVSIAGWPLAHELEGRVIVVVTDEVDSYADVGTAAFVARAPELRAMDGDVEHLGAANVVFYNADRRDLDANAVAAIQAGGGSVRTYSNPRCEPIEFGTNPPAANYRAVDVEPGQPRCGPTAQPPPVDTPVPLFSAPLFSAAD